MPNPYFSDLEEHKSRGGSAKMGRKSGGKPMRASFNEKAAFPSADLPGKTQPRDRSAGVKRARTSPKKMGL